MDQRHDNINFKAHILEEGIMPEGGSGKPASTDKSYLSGILIPMGKRHILRRS